jgi:hypothetical protein
LEGLNPETESLRDTRIAMRPRDGEARPVSLPLAVVARAWGVRIP